MILPEESVLERERREALAHAVAALPERMRLIIHAVYVEERSVKEIAEQLGVSHSAVSQQRSEAVRLLHDALERYSEGDAMVPVSRVSVETRDAYFARIDALEPPRLPITPHPAASPARAATA